MNVVYCVYLDVHEENLVQLFLSDDYVDLTLHKLVSMCSLVLYLSTWY